MSEPRHYVLLDKGDRYHHVDGIRDGLHGDYERTTVVEAIARGYTPCPTCYDEVDDHE